MNDPYLIPGQVCEVLDNDNIKYYMDFRDYRIITGIKMPTFEDIKYYNMILSTDRYRPIGTEWDFAPDWAVCSTIYKDGSVRLWGNEKHAEHFNKKDTRWLNSHSQFCVCECGICPDPTRYQGDAWLDSLRLRPEWAKGGYHFDN